MKCFSRGAVKNIFWGGGIAQSDEPRRASRQPVDRTRRRASLPMWTRDVFTWSKLLKFIVLWTKHFIYRWILQVIWRPRWRPTTTAIIQHSSVSLLIRGLSNTFQEVLLLPIYGKVADRAEREREREREREHRTSLAALMLPMTSLTLTDEALMMMMMSTKIGHRTLRPRVGLVLLPASLFVPLALHMSSGRVHQPSQCSSFTLLMKPLSLSLSLLGINRSTAIILIIKLYCSSHFLKRLLLILNHI